MTNISQIMKQAKEMQEKIWQKCKKKIEETEIEGTSGGGSCKSNN